MYSHILYSHISLLLLKVDACVQSSIARCLRSSWTRYRRPEATTRGTLSSIPAAVGDPTRARKRGTPITYVTGRNGYLYEYYLVSTGRAF